MSSQHIGAAGELLVQYLLLKEGIDSARLTTDSGIDLVAYAPRTSRAVTIQVKTQERPLPAGGKGALALGYNFPHTLRAELLALVDLSTDSCWLFSRDEALTLAQQRSAKDVRRLYWYLETPTQTRLHGQLSAELLEGYRLVTRIAGLIVHGDGPAAEQDHSHQTEDLDSENPLTLHLAMRHVLVAAGRPLTPREIADEVNRRRLYHRGDGAPVASRQVSARVGKHPRMFVNTSDGVWLADEAVREEPSPGPLTASTELRVTVQRSPIPASHAEPLTAIETALLTPERFLSAAIIDDQIPAGFGLYAIRVNQVAVLPEPYRMLAENRGSALLYLGEATGQTLRERFLCNELRGQGHGTFFRSLGALLGYRPPAGSLIGKASQRNFRFSAVDNVAIVEWINANLEVSWVTFDDDVHAAEVTLIGKHTPLLNLRDNPKALPELSALRATCREIAMTPASS